jgi:bifunctional DNA-binding transcriptional regulator/antitoxin component of YhaV-PrlF toxin-antitoxin module
MCFPSFAFVFLCLPRTPSHLPAGPAGLANSLPIGNLRDMKTTVMVDKGGRLVLPKPVRDAIGISGPMSVNIEVVAGTAQISAPERQRGEVARRRGRTVYTGPLPPDWDSGEAVSRMRERRIQE